MVHSERGAAIEHGKRFIGMPYYWGGEGPLGFDCSGLMVEILRMVGIIARKADYNAQGLYKLTRHNSVQTANPGDFVFFGQSVSTITHVGMVVDVLNNGTVLVLEATGGRSGIDTVEEAHAADALVTIRPLRGDLVAITDPFGER
jgi:hypothetical protein